MYRVTFVWENFGPTHDDRLSACTGDPNLEVDAIQFATQDAVYEWSSSELRSVPTQTIFRERPVRGSNFLLLLGLLKALSRSPGKVVFFCHYERWPVFCAALLRRMLCGKNILMFDSKFDDYQRSIWRELLKRVYLAPYHGAIVGSHRSEKYYAFLCGTKKPVGLGYDTISSQRVRDMGVKDPLRQFPIQSRPFICVARLVEKKNHITLLRAYAEWRALTGGGRRLRLIGSGPLEKRLRLLAYELGISDYVDFEGFLQIEDVCLAIQSSLCLILPSTEEQFGFVVTEALALGIPVVVSSNAGACDVVVENGINGWVIDPNNPRTLVKAMCRIHESPDEWRRMSIEASAGGSKGDVQHFVSSVVYLCKAVSG